MTAGLQLGRPGVYRVPVREPEELSEVRLDVTGFAGVALRGPVNVATPVISWADYQSRFGGLEPNVSGRDRLLPYAVQAFFAQGGRRAVIVRVAPQTADPGVLSDAESMATFRLGPTGGSSSTPSLLLAAADEGAWGTALDLGLEFAVAVTATAALPILAGRRSLDRIELLAAGTVRDASLVRIRYADAPIGVLRWARLVDDPVYRDRLMSLDQPLPAGVDSNWTAPATVSVEVVTGTLSVVDPSTGRRERISGLGLHPEHHRYPAAVLARESLLVRFLGEDRPQLRPDPLLAAWHAERLQAGRDRSDAVSFESFFDPGAADADLLDADLLDHQLAHRGVDLLGRVPEIGLLCVPDLGWRTAPVPPATKPTPAGPPLVWPADCECPPEHPEPELAARAPAVDPLLDGTNDADLAELLDRQQRVVQVADLRRRFVALLDVPMGLPTARITDWRAAFDSSYAAAYHPWLGVPRADDLRAPAVRVPPSAFAAGITADRERRLGLSRGPANQLALGAVIAADPISDALADQLHLQSINVFVPERDGFRLSAARTLTSDANYRQLSVRRLMSMLRLTLERYGEVLVFEPNTDDLRDRLTNAVTELLRGLHRRGAFSGATEEQSFFVRCDDSTNPTRSQAQGRLVAEVGVAPAAPLEYLVLRIASDGEGALLVDEQARTRVGSSGALVGVPGV